MFLGVFPDPRLRRFAPECANGSPSGAGNISTKRFTCSEFSFQVYSKTRDPPNPDRISKREAKRARGHKWIYLADEYTENQLGPGLELMLVESHQQSHYQVLWWTIGTTRVEWVIVGFRLISSETETGCSIRSASASSTSRDSLSASS